MVQNYEQSDPRHDHYRVITGVFIRLINFQAIAWEDQSHSDTPQDTHKAVIADFEAKFKLFQFTVPPLPKCFKYTFYLQNICLLIIVLGIWL